VFIVSLQTSSPFTSKLFFFVFSASTTSLMLAGDGVLLSRVLAWWCALVPNPDDDVDELDSRRRFVETGDSGDDDDEEDRGDTAGDASSFAETVTRGKNDVTAGSTDDFPPSPPSFPLFPSSPASSSTVFPSSSTATAGDDERDRLTTSSGAFGDDEGDSSPAAASFGEGDGELFAAVVMSAVIGDGSSAVDGSCWCGSRRSCTIIFG
jgi:hypothetical protein